MTTYPSPPALTKVDPTHVKKGSRIHAYECRVVQDACVPTSFFFFVLPLLKSIGS